MFDFLRLFPRRPLLISVAAWVIFFTMQVGYLTYVMSERYVPPPESRPYDRLWFVYTQLPRMLPMAAIYAGCAVLVAQILGRFIALDNPSNLTIAQWARFVKDNPTRGIIRVGLVLVAVLTTIGLLVGLSTDIVPRRVGLILGFVAGFCWTQIFIPPWFDWLVEGGTRQRNADADDTH